MIATSSTSTLVSLSASGCVQGLEYIIAVLLSHVELANNTAHHHLVQAQIAVCGSLADTPPADNSISTRCVKHVYMSNVSIS